MFYKITYDTIILKRRAIKFLDYIFHYISKVLALNLLDEEKISVQKLYNTANQNNSVINS